MASADGPAGHPLMKRQADPDPDPDSGFIEAANRPVYADEGLGYDVFLSFRGTDYRQSFIDCLYHRLDDAGVCTFKDDLELPVGGEIGPELMKAIKQSKISIPIFSKDYASSKWCLKEVAEMVKRMDERKHMIMPIFLDVTPNEVQHQTGSYKKAFSQHDKKYDSETVKEWRDALQKVVKLKGLELEKEANGNQGEFIKLVLARILNSLKKGHVHVNDEQILVALDHKTEALKRLLEVGGSGVKIVGIWGMGGIGKTTLAKVVYNQMLDQFASSCFLSDIRETERSKGLPHLQSKLVSDILNERSTEFANVDEGIQQLKRRLGGKKAIILLDDVDKVDQLKGLAGRLDWFGPGSRIIITTRDKEVLRNFEVNNIYEVMPLSEDQGFELFCKHAFVEGLPTPGFIDLARDIARATGMLPLTLKVIGSSLYSKSRCKAIWQDTLKKLLRARPEEAVQHRLKLSYDDLGDTEKKIFLDIACIFIGMDSRTAIPMWEDRHWFPHIGIEILVCKSLIKITDENKFWMHDQIRDLGREIVERESNHPRSRSRLWRPEEANDVLKRNKGTAEVEAISLGDGNYLKFEYEGDHFRNLSELKILRLGRATLGGNFKGLLPELRLLSWNVSLDDPIPTDLDLRNLISLDLSESSVSEDWGGWRLMKVASKLKVLDLSRCGYLSRTPDFSSFPALERLVLRGCSRLLYIDSSVGQLSALVSLDLRGCESMCFLPNLEHLTNLEELYWEVYANEGLGYDVFLSFRGTDYHESFVDCLYHRLDDAGVRTFKDDLEIPVGEELGPKLTKAMMQSKISIPIFSKNYASSKWCLKEVAEMVKRMDERKHMIMPIFLDVTPNEVQHQTGSYKKAFSLHDKKYDSETVKEWRDALQKVVKLKGLELKKEANGKQGEFIKLVLARILNSLKKCRVHVHEQILVALDHKTEALKRLLEVGGSGVKIVGIWGMRGIGKTTLAKVVYNQMLGQFASSCFLSDIRETARSKGLPYLQRKLVSGILNEGSTEFANVDEGIQQLKRRLGGKKAIILLDDVDHVDQLKGLAGSLDWFGSGSRIIITTRDKKVLQKFEVNNIYEVMPLSEDQGFELFCKYAFLNDSPTPDFIDLARDIVRATGMLPLTLEVIGSFLSTKSRRKATWQDTLKKLRARPDEAVQHRLKLSYDDLGDTEKNIFLDIACIFIGMDPRTAIPMWDDRNWFPHTGIEILVSKSLIKITDENKFWMHDQIRDLGREIVERKSYNHPGSRSRLWRPEEANGVLKRNEGTAEVEAISLSDGNYLKFEYEGDHFRNLSKLKILRLGRATLGGNFKGLLPELKLLSWNVSRYDPIPTDLDLRNLISLDLSESSVSEDWGGWRLMKVASKLKVLDLSRCRYLSRTPDFSSFPALERLVLRGCSRLLYIDSSVGQLSALVSLDLRCCDSMRSLPNLEHLTNLEELYLGGSDELFRCWEVSVVPGLHGLISLKTLKIGKSNVTHLDGLEMLEWLRELEIHRSPIERLPNLSKLKRLTDITLVGCEMLRQVEGFELVESLERLTILWCTIVTLPDLSKLRKLKWLILSHCFEITEIRGLGHLESLEILAIDRLSNLREISGFEELENLETLILSIWGGIHKLMELSQPHDLKRFLVLQTKDAREFIHVFGDKNYDFRALANLPNMSNLRRLRTLKIEGLSNLTEIAGLEGLDNLETLEVRECGGIKKLPDLSKLRGLKSLSIKKFPDLWQQRTWDDIF